MVWLFKHNYETGMGEIVGGWRDQAGGLKAAEIAAEVLKVSSPDATVLAVNGVLTGKVQTVPIEQCRDAESWWKNIKRFQDQDIVPSTE